MSDSPRIFTLSQFNQAIEKRLTEFFAHKRTWVAAELRKINGKGGNLYLELSDSKDGSETARLSAFMWATNVELVQKQLSVKLSEILIPGNKVLFELKVTFHPIHGLKAHVLNIDPNYTYGAIERQKQENIKKLKAEGIFDRQHSVRLPLVMKRIALIGSPGTSGFRDFENELLQNRLFTNFKVKVFPSSVQGEKAQPELIKALLEADQYDVDTIVMLRGGGSKMDLHIFNDYELCKTICNLNHPVMTGIGHETDVVIADMVCRQSHITPSAVAQFLYTRIGIFASDIQGAYDKVLQHALQMTGGAREEFEGLVKYLIVYTQQLLSDENRTMSTVLHQLELVVSRILKGGLHNLDLTLRHIENTTQLQAQRERHQLELTLGDVKHRAQSVIRHVHEPQLEALLERMTMLSANTIDNQRLGLENLVEKLTYLNPETLLEKGYTLSYVGDTDVNSLEQDLENKEMTTLTHQQIIKSTISSVNSRHHD